MHPYRLYVHNYVSLGALGAHLPLGTFPPLPRPELAADAPKVLIFSPHPDDECIIGALALRLMRESGYQVVNVAVESSEEDLADLVAATSFHVGEVRRNPYHVVLPAWMMDNVRRGGELVGGQGGAAPTFTFATLYRVRRWQGGQFERFYPGGRMLPANQPAGSLFT